jgi:hypothetical protein
VAETVTSLELFAFVLLPIGVAASAWAVIVVAERRGSAKGGPREKVSDGPK